MNGNSASLAACVLAAGLAGFAGGCGIQSGTTVVTQSMRNDPIMGNALTTGTYAVYTATGMNAIATAKVNEGEPLGFRTGDDGHWIAVAGKQTFDLPRGTAQAYWKLESGR